MFILGILFGITNGTCRFLWGFLLDKYGFKKLMFIIATTEIISSCSLYYTVGYDWLYIFIVLLLAACLGGNFVCIIPLYTHIYGMDAGPRMYALCGACIGLAQFCCPLLVKFFLKKKKDYLIIFLFSGTLCVIKFISLMFFDDKEKITVNSKFNCEDENKDNNKNDLLTKN